MLAGEGRGGTSLGAEAWFSQLTARIEQSWPIGPVGAHASRRAR